MDVKELHTVHTQEADPVEQLYRSYRPLAFSIAYRMLGTVTDAEDAVQDLFAGMVGRNLDDVRHIKPYIAKWMTNRCLNVLQSSRRTRETYFGEWLPEPIVEQGEQPDQVAERVDSLSYAYMVMLERMTPMERAVFLLREVFEYEYEEIADTVGKTASNCRKILSRAKEHAREYSPSASQDTEARRTLVSKFVTAFQQYDMEALLSLLSEDVRLTTDGGGRVHAAMRPIIGRSRVLRLLTSPKAFVALRSWDLSFTMVNTSMNMVYWEQGVVKAVCCCELTAEQDRISNVYVIFNPDKLDHISRIEK
ncbi:RNA polymerase sigma-70 factor [Paenibacillus alvei]|uniref:RNA polymerase sigma-70 factor n=1 Tax=Paenibacillus alvei TaxID=44250 RepID=UPI0013DB103B|nr:RNA polymerase sigma-70 factor [Paenibacillus alvei]NEZ42408.1 RNA polymerase sigma-70 factor [Paenibacillus alvei]